MKYIKEMLLVKNRITINEFLNNYPNFNDKSKNKDGSQPHLPNLLKNSIHS